MAYKIAGSMFTRRCWPWWCATSRSTMSISLRGGCSAAIRNSCGLWLPGCSTKGSRRRSWNPPRSTGDLYGKRLEMYWKPICEQRDDRQPGSATLHLALALSNRGRRGRKRDFADAERLVKRLVAGELTLSFVPDSEQRLWRTVTRRKYQLTRDRVRLQNQLEALLEEAHIKLSSLVSDLLGASARRILQALAKGETDPALWRL